MLRLPPFRAQPLRPALRRDRVQGRSWPNPWRQADIQKRRIDIVVVYKVDRLTRSLADFAKMVDLFDAHGVSFVR
jgi:hypothetical protein